MPENTSYLLFLRDGGTSGRFCWSRLGLTDVDRPLSRAPVAGWKLAGLGRPWLGWLSPVRCHPAGSLSFFWCQWKDSKRDNENEQGLLRPETWNWHEVIFASIGQSKSEPVQFKEWGVKSSISWWKKIQSHISRDVQRGVESWSNFFFQFSKNTFLPKSNCPRLCKVFTGILYFFHSCRFSQQEAHLLFHNYFHKLYFYMNNIKYLLLFFKKVFFYYDYQQKPSTFHCHCFPVARNPISNMMNIHLTFLSRLTLILVPHWISNRILHVDIKKKY